MGGITRYHRHVSTFFVGAHAIGRSLLLARKSGRGGKRKLEVEADFVEASLRDCSSPIFRSLLALFRIQIQ